MFITDTVGMDAVEVGYWLASSFMMIVIANGLFVPMLVYCRITDHWILLLGALSGFIFSMLIAFTTNTLMAFLGAAAIFI